MRLVPVEVPHQLFVVESSDIQSDKALNFNPKVICVHLEVEFEKYCRSAEAENLRSRRRVVFSK